MAMSRLTITSRNPGVNECVRSRKYPITEGVTRLPRLPIELMRPMDAAAADSPRKAEGTGQKAGRKALAVEAAVKHKNANQKWEPERIVSANATTPSMSGMAVCQRRSLVRSEC